MSDMALEKMRTKFTAMLDPMVARLGWMNPNYISWFSLGVAALSAWLFATAARDGDGTMKILSATLLLAFAAFCDGIDGQIARMHGKASRYGDYLDHTIDRIVDIGIIIALGVNVAWVSSPHLGWAAALATLMGSYMGTQAQSVGLGRNYRGFGRADRLALTLLGGLAAAWQAFSGMVDMAEIPLFGGGLNAFSIVLLISLLGGLYTFTTRFVSGLKALADEPDAPQGGDNSDEDV